LYIQPYGTCQAATLQHGFLLQGILPTFYSIGPHPHPLFDIWILSFDILIEMIIKEYVIQFWDTALLAAPNFNSAGGHDAGETFDSPGNHRAAISLHPAFQTENSPGP
jgi:hypothetical protein